jgi:hypothetical protein
LRLWSQTRRTLLTDDGDDWHRVQWPVLPVRHAFRHRPVIVCLVTSAPYTSARCAAISACVSPFADREITISSAPGQPPLPFSDNFRLEAGIPVAWHADLHRTRIGEHTLRSAAVAGIAAVAARRVILA